MKSCIIETILCFSRSFGQNKTFFTKNTFCTAVIYQYWFWQKNLTFFNRVRIIVALISAVFPLFALLPFLSFSVSLFIYLLFLLMVISNLICIQITSPGGTPIRGKNAGYRKCLLILLTPPSPPFPLSSSSFHLSVSPLPALCPLHLLRHFFCLYHLTVQRCVWSWKRQKQETGSHLFSNKITDNSLLQQLSN